MIKRYNPTPILAHGEPAGMKKDNKGRYIAYRAHLKNKRDSKIALLDSILEKMEDMASDIYDEETWDRKWYRLELFIKNLKPKGS